MKDRVKKANESAIVVSAELAPWLGTLPTAWAIGHAVYTVIGWPLPVAIITGLSVELLGLVSMSRVLTLYDYQLTKRATWPSAGRALALSVLSVVGYFASTLVLTVYLERNLVLGLFPVLSLVSTLNLALSANHAARLAHIDQERQERKEKRQELAIAKETKAVPVAKARSASTYSDFAIVQDGRNGKGVMTAKEVEQIFGVPKRTAYNWIRKYTQEVNDETKINVP